MLLNVTIFFGTATMILGGIIVLIQLAIITLEKLGVGKQICEGYWQYLKNKNKKVRGG